MALTCGNRKGTHRLPLRPIPIRAGQYFDRGESWRRRSQGCPTSRSTASRQTNPECQQPGLDPVVDLDVLDATVSLSTTTNSRSSTRTSSSSSGPPPPFRLEEVDPSLLLSPLAGIPPLDPILAGEVLSLDQPPARELGNTSVAETCTTASQERVLSHSPTSGLRSSSDRAIGKRSPATEARRMG
jgi:hypothetical protein